MRFRPRPVSLCVVSICLSCVALGQANPGSAKNTYPSLRAGFAHPPAEARLRCYWWWLNGHTDKPTITHDLEEMAAKGFGGALLVDADGSGQGGNQEVPAGPTFGSPAWVELYTHALREADRLGLEITLNINGGWNLGGPGVTPGESSKLLTWSRTPVSGGKRVSLQLEQPATKNDFYRQIAVLAYPLHNPATITKPSGLPGLRQRSASVEAGFSMPESDWMLSLTGTPGGGSGLSRPSENDLRQGVFNGSATAEQSLTQPDATLAEVRDLSSLVGADGKLSWDAPPGSWEILRIGYTNSDARVSTSSGKWQGRALDHMSRAAFDSYWNSVVEPLLSAAKPFHSLKYLATDSWELGGTNWTETFAAEFKARRGYDAVPWLPVVAGRIIGSPDQSARFLTDLRRTVADLIVANHFDRFAERAAEHHLGVQAESGGPHGAPIDALETFQHSAIPQTEFWSQNPHRETDLQRFFPKEAASAANIYGQRFVAAEGETSINRQWNESLAADLKPSFDMAITEGMNRLVWHQFTSSPASTGLPGQEYFAGTHLNPKITWWNAGTAFFTYLNRVQFLMQQGAPVNDVLYFSGDNIPSFVRLKADDPAHVLPGYDYDVTDEDALLHTLNLQDAKLIGPGGVVWKLLVLPTSRRLSPAALSRIERYVRAGGTVAGLPPTSSTGRIGSAEQAQFAALTQRIWQGCAPETSHAYEHGRVYCSENANGVLAAMRVQPDFTYTNEQGQVFPKPFSSSSSGIDYIHRRAGDSDIYFVRNAAAQSVNLKAEFRATGKRVEAWDPVTGDVSSLPAELSEASGLTKVSLRLPAFGSVFVLFSRDASAHDVPILLQPALLEPVVLLRPWTLTFEGGRGAPSGPQAWKDLTSWTGSENPGVRYFSGTGTYRTSIQAPAAGAGKPLYLKFSDVREIARVRVNGKDAGTVWAQPYHLRLDSLLHPGANELEVEVTNLWPNRIIGDLQPGAKERFTQTNITEFRASSALLPSGLIGPLQWEVQDSPLPSVKHSTH